VGLEIWRIEKFHVKPWPKDHYGQFFSGDSYIVLNTWKKPDSDALHWDVHFWLGKYTSQDEAGTAAYKTVELDDHLHGAPIQHREVQGYESSLFLTYFKDTIRILEGGVDSGFKHVKPEEYKPRLLHLKGKKKVRVTEVDLSFKSLNSGDVFLLDNGLIIYQWEGAKSGPMERQKGASLSHALASERNGKAKVQVLEEKEKDQGFWKILGEGPIQTAEQGGSDLETEKGPEAKLLFRLSDASGKFEFTEVAKGAAVKKDKLDSNDVFILDTGNEVYAWIGKKASVQEKAKALSFAQEYLTKHNRPPHLPIARVLEGGENATFNAALN